MENERRIKRERYLKLRERDGGSGDGGKGGFGGTRHGEAWNDGVSRN